MIIEAGYEVILPTSGKKIMTRGLKVKELLAIQNVSIVEDSLKVKTLGIANIAYACINNKEIFNNDFNVFLNQITDTDLNSIVFGIIYSTYGKDLPITYSCTKKDVTPDLTKFTEEEKEEVKRGTLSGKVDLDKIKIEGKVNIDCKPMDVNEVSINDKITFTYTPFQFMTDSISALTYLKTLGITNTIDVQNLPKEYKEKMERISFSSLVSTIRTIKTENETKVRPSYDSDEGISEWYNRMFDLCQDLPLKDMKKVELKSNPYTVTFKAPVVCKVCKQRHVIAIDCLQRLIEFATE
jgi:hypothetical protein